MRVRLVLNQKRDVDCVLATVEIEKLIDEKLKENDMDHFIKLGTIEGEIVYTHGGGGSGGYLESIFRRVAAEIYNQPITGALKYEPIRRNKDFLETVLKDEETGQVKLRFAKAYGFRSIQNLVTRMKARKGVQFDYIEVMACPERFSIRASRTCGVYLPTVSLKLTLTIWYGIYRGSDMLSDMCEDMSLEILE